MTLMVEQRADGAVGKALVLLEVLGEHTGAVALSDLALAVGLPRSTTHRLLKELLQRGYVGRVGSKYRIGSRLLELGQAAHWSEYGEIRERTWPALEWLFDQTGLTVHLAVLDEREVLYLEKITGAGGCRIPSRVGTRLPATCTGLGKALLAFSTRAAVEDVMHSALPRLTPYSIVTPGKLADELRRVREAGVATEREEAKLGIACLAAPILIEGRARAALSIAGLSSRLTVEAHIPAIRRAAADAAERLSATY